jgi:CRISPR-associated endonuclease/helicase Cas3
MELLSHPDKDLITHLSNVRDIGLNIFHSKNKLNLKYSYEDIKLSLSNMLFYHDIGKSTKYFQDYMRASINKIEYTDNSELKKHSLISAVYASYKTFLELNNKESKEILPVLVFLAIRKHHGDFENIKDMVVISKNNWRNLKIQWDNLQLNCIGEKVVFDFKSVKEYINDILFNIEDIEKSTDNYLLLNFFFSILTYADKNDAKFSSQIKFAEFPFGFNNWVDKYKNIKYEKEKHTTKLNKIRNEIYNLCEINITPKNIADHNIFSINVPTGSGKTLAGINAALKIITTDSDLKRIIYAVPFTSIIEQIYKDFFDIIENNDLEPENYIIKHYHLAEAKIKNDENDYIGDNAQFLIENWDKPIILTTFWQLFNTLISNKNKLIKKFHNLTNSVIILDEIQTMPYEYWELINHILIKATNMLNCKIIFMTATMPLIFLEEKKEIIPLIGRKKTNQYFQEFSRYEMKFINHMNTIKMSEFFEIAEKHIISAPKKSFLFVFNTIKSSLDFYNRIKKIRNKNIIYLSTNIIPKDRLERIEQIKHSDNYKIVVSTQLIEAGVDIDLNIVYRDFSPFDSIIQTAGRCNRNSSPILGEVFLFKLIDSKNQKKYCNYIYKPISLIPTNEIIQNLENVKESDLLNVIKLYYKSIKENASTDISQKLISDIKALNYSNIAENFLLIKNIPNILVFIEKDINASKVLSKFKEMLKLDRWERKDEFLKIKKEFYDYIISVKLNPENINALKELEELGNLKIISNDMLSVYYNNDIGFTYNFDNFI